MSQSLSPLVSESNVDLIVKALKHIGGTGDKWNLYFFLWVEDSTGKHQREGFQRNGRAFAVDRIQHDLRIACEEGRVMIVKDGPNHWTYYLSESELWN